MKLIYLGIVILFVTGCVQTTKPAETVHELVIHDSLREPLIFTGYGTEDQFSDYPVRQRRLLAIRAAKMDAYRNAAEQVFGVQISGSTAVTDMVIENDHYSGYVEAVLQGAKVLAIKPVGNGIYEAEIEYLPPDDLSLVDAASGCGRSAVSISQCWQSQCTHVDCENMQYPVVNTYQY